jgi:hypothetical protein
VFSKNPLWSGKSSQLNHLRSAASCLPEFHSEVSGEVRILQAEEDMGDSFGRGARI